MALKSLTRPTVRCETLNLTLRPDEALHTIYKHSIFTLDTPIITLTLIVHYQAIQLNYSAHTISRAKTCTEPIEN